MSDFDGLVSQLVARARLLEKALHDPGPWFAVVRADWSGRHRVSRVICEEERRVSFTVYVDEPCSKITAVELYAGHSLVTARQVDGLPSSPCRITLDFGILTEPVS